MALDHRRLIRPEKKSGRAFCVRQVYFTKCCQKIWVRVNQPFIPVHLYITSEVKQYYEALFLSYRPRTECSISQFLQHKLHSFNIQDHRSMRGLLVQTVKKNIQNHQYGQPALTFVVRDVVECLKDYEQSLFFSIVRRAKRETRKWACA